MTEETAQAKSEVDHIRKELAKYQTVSGSDFQAVVDTYATVMADIEGKAEESFRHRAAWDVQVQQATERSTFDLNNPHARLVRAPLLVKKVVVHRG